MSDRPRVPPEVLGVVEAWLRHHDRLAPGLVDGCVVTGSAVLDDWTPRSDIDLVTLLSRDPVGADIDALRAAHAAARRDTDVDVDGPRLLRSDVATAPESLVCAWSLGDDFRHDDECFELHPVTWLTVVNHGVAMRGPAPTDLGIVLDAASVHSFIQQNTNEYWLTIPAQIDALLARSDEQSFDAEMTSWCVLGIARMLFTAVTGDVTSKRGAGEWIVDRLPVHRTLVERALEIRRVDDAGLDDRATLEATADYLREVGSFVTAAPVPTP